MKLTIEKLPSGNVRITFSPDGAKKPIVIDATAQQIASVLAIVQSASKADVFNLTLNL